jgi:SAM-dependent methyltransferase
VRTLNLGCGNDLYGTDRIDVVPTKATTLVHDLELGIPFPRETFDEVYSKNNLEHVRNVGLYFEEIGRVLKPEGKLVLITDNALSLHWLLGTHSGGYDKHGGKDRHYALFTMEHLKNHLESVGLQILEMRLIETDYFTRYFDRFIRLFVPSMSYPRIFVKAQKPLGIKVLSQ